MSRVTDDDESLCQELNCSICFDPLTAPVTLRKCLHSFCKHCLERTIEGARETNRYPYFCPQCRRRFSPSEVAVVNHHLQNIVGSNRRRQERRAEFRRNRTDASRSRNTDVDNLKAVLTKADVVVASLVTAMDRACARVGVTEQPAPLVSDETSVRRPGRPRTSRQQHVHLDLPRNEPSAPLLEEDRAESNTAEVNDRQTTADSDCVFEAETSQQFLNRSVIVFRRHFLLIVFIIHASIFVVCLFKAMV